MYYLQIAIAPYSYSKTATVEKRMFIAKLRIIFSD